MIAKFAGNCRRCGGRIQVGETIDWSRDTGALHPQCPQGATIPAPARREKPAELTPGVYETNGTVYIVRPTRDKARLYAMRLVEVSGSRLTEGEGKVQIDFEYDRGAIFSISPEDRMPFERAKELTVLYSRCIVCGRHLEDAKSVANGIGPVCIKAFPDAPTAQRVTGRKKVLRKVYETEFAEVA
jgi:hypothetical protein